MSTGTGAAVAAMGDRFAGHAADPRIGVAQQRRQRLGELGVRPVAHQAAPRARASPDRGRCDSSTSSSGVGGGPKYVSSSIARSRSFGVFRLSARMRLQLGLPASPKLRLTAAIRARAQSLWNCGWSSACSMPWPKLNVLRRRRAGPAHAVDAAVGAAAAGAEVQCAVRPDIEAGHVQRPALEERRHLRLVRRAVALELDRVDLSHRPVADEQRVLQPRRETPCGRSTRRRSASRGRCRPSPAGCRVVLGPLRPAAPPAEFAARRHVARRASADTTVRRCPIPCRHRR